MKIYLDTNNLICFFTHVVTLVSICVSVTLANEAVIPVILPDDVIQELIKKAIDRHDLGYIFKMVCCSVGGVSW